MGALLREVECCSESRAVFIGKAPSFKHLLGPKLALWASHKPGDAVFSSVKGVVSVILALSTFLAWARLENRSPGGDSSLLLVGAQSLTQGQC